MAWFTEVCKITGVLVLLVSAWQSGYSFPYQENQQCDTQLLNELVTVSCIGTLTPNNIPSNLLSNTNRLDISYNNFHHITKKTFQDLNLGHLSHLIIKNSQVESIDEDAFKDSSFAKSLKKIDLSGNRLKNSLFVKIFEHLPSLTSIDLRSNTNLDCQDVIDSLSNLDVQCDSGGITTLAGRSKWDLTKYFSMIPPPTTPAVQCSELCDCSQRKRVRSYSVICQGTLNDTLPSPLPPNIFSLDLSNNNFKNMTKNTLQSLKMPFLNHLIIKNSKVELIDEDTFQNAMMETSLRKFDLFGNNLNTSNVIKLVKRLRHLQWIDLRSNPNVNCKELKENLGDVIVLCDEEEAPNVSSSVNLEIQVESDRPNETTPTSSTHGSSSTHESTSTETPVAVVCNDMLIFFLVFLLGMMVGGVLSAICFCAFPCFCKKRSQENSNQQGAQENRAFEEQQPLNNGAEQAADQ